MKLSEYFTQPGAKSKQEVAKEAKVSYHTVKSAAKGMRIAKYDVASRVSKVCTLKGAAEVLVPINELCEE